MRKWFRASLWLAVCWSAAGGAGAQDTQPEVLDPVVVQGARLRDLRGAMNKAQDRFLDQYNKLNKDARQRVSCSDEAPTGSRLSRRSCSTRERDDITQEQARGLLQSMADSGAYGGAEALSRETRAKEIEARAANGVRLSQEEMNELRELRNPTLDHTDGEGTPKVADESVRFANNLQSLFDKYPDLKELGDEYLEARRRYEAAGGQ